MRSGAWRSGGARATRLIALVVAIAATWLGIPQVAAAVVAPATPAATYNYDGCYRAAVAADLTTERGPTTTGHHYTPYDGVHRCSRGPSACSDGSTECPITNYDSRTTLPQVACAACTPTDEARQSDTELSRPARAGVAANSGDDAVQLFRHAGPEELADLKATGTFNLGKNSTGKYFADNAQDASAWGAWLNGGQGGVVSTTVPGPSPTK